MNRIIRAFAAFIVSICLILAPAISYAASPVGWSASPADIIMNGATATITAIKGAGSSALQSTAKHAPTVGNIGKKILKGAGPAAVLMAVTQILGKAVDYVLDPANNAIKYKLPDDTQYGWKSRGVGGFASAEAACMDTLLAYVTPDKVKNYTFAGVVQVDSSNRFTCRIQSQAGSVNDTGTVERIGVPDEPKWQSIPINTVAAKVQANAQAGDVPSQELIKTVVIDDFNAGVIDPALNINAVPVADAPPVNPPYDPTQPAPPFDPSSIIAAIKSVMSAVVNMAGMLSAKIDALMVEMGLQNAETQRVINDGMADVVAANNATGARVGDVVAAIEALEGNTLDGKVINDAVDRAIAAGHTDTASIVAAIEAIEGNTLDGQVINDAVDRVIANDNVNAQSAADAANTAADAAKAADAANTAAVTDAVEAQTDAITEADPITGEMSLKFPKFCSWALPVCTFTDWAMADPQLEEPEDTRPEIQDLTKYDTVDISQKYVTATGQCPPAADLNINFGVVKLSYEPLCIILDKLSGVIVAVAYISVGFMIIRTV